MNSEGSMVTTRAVALKGNRWRYLVFGSPTNVSQVSVDPCRGTLWQVQCLLQYQTPVTGLLLMCV